MSDTFLNPVTTQTWANGRHIVRCVKVIQETWDVRTFCFIDHDQRTIPLKGVLTKEVFAAEIARSRAKNLDLIWPDLAVPTLKQQRLRSRCHRN